MRQVQGVAVQQRGLVSERRASNSLDQSEKDQDGERGQVAWHSAF